MLVKQSRHFPNQMVPRQNEVLKGSFTWKKEEIEVKEEDLEEINIKIVFLIPKNPYLDLFLFVNHPFKEPALLLLCRRRRHTSLLSYGEACNMYM